MDPIGTLIDMGLHWLIDNSGHEPTQLQGNDPLTGNPPPESGLPTAYSGSVSGTFDADFTNWRLFPSNGGNPDAGATNGNSADGPFGTGPIDVSGWTPPPLVQAPPDYPADAPLAGQENVSVEDPNQPCPVGSDPADWQPYPDSTGNPDSGTPQGTGNSERGAASDASEASDESDAGSGADAGAGGAADTGDAGGSAAAGGACFVAGTPVLIEGGRFVAIDALRLGDFVMARHEKTGEMAPRRVTRVWSHENRPTLSVRLADGTDVATTREHRFANDSGRFAAIGDYTAGARLSAWEGIAEIAAIERLDDRSTVYNITVDEFHTYFVGASKLWVHNEKSTTGESDGGEIPEDD